MSGDTILYDVTDGVATITVNRPQRLNALNRDTVRALEEAAHRARTDSSAAAVIITGAGPKAFVAGADISELAESGPLGLHATALVGQQALSALETMEKPVIAAINGFALGGGLELALACHLRVAGGNAVLGLPEVGLGIIPGYGGTQRLTRLIGPSRAADMILTGRKVAAAEAEHLGLINRLVPEGEAVPAAVELARTILAQGPLAVSFALRAMRLGLEMPLAAGLAIEASLFGLISSSSDTAEGLRAFLEKRRPVFQGR